MRPTRLRPRLALIMAHVDLESICLERDLFHEKQRLEVATPTSSTTGLVLAAASKPSTRSWSRAQRTSPARCGCGSSRVVAWWSAAAASISLYDYGLATDEADDAFNDEDSEGFVRLWGLACRRGPPEQAPSATDGPTPDGGTEPEPTVSSSSGTAASRAARRGAAGPSP